MFAQTQSTYRGQTVDPSRSWNSAFERLARPQHLESGEEIFAQEAPAARVYRVVSGAVRTTRLMSDGRRQVSDFYFPGDLFGLEVGPTHRSAAEALGSCEILAVGRRGLPLAGEDGAMVQRLIWQATGEQLERAQDHMLLLSRRSAYEKLACFLSEIAERHEHGWACLPMCRQDIADYLGLTIETVSRMMTQLQNDGAVRLDGSRRFQVVRPHPVARDLAA